MKRTKPQPSFALCVRTDGALDLEQRKVYQVLPDRAASRDGYVRVVDESGEDYLYPAACFVTVRLPAAAVRNLEASDLIQEPANTALQPTGRGRQRRSRARVHAARG
jgi:hypothetical protein